MYYGGSPSVRGFPRGAIPLAYAKKAFFGQETVKGRDGLQRGNVDSHLKETAPEVPGTPLTEKKPPKAERGRR